MELIVLHNFYNYIWYASSSSETVSYYVEDILTTDTHNWSVNDILLFYTGQCCSTLYNTSDQANVSRHKTQNLLCSFFTYTL